MKKLILPLLLLVLLGAGFWLYTGPQRALRDIKVAAQAGDVEGVRERVDVPAVKESLKEQLKSVMQKKMETELKDNPFGALGMMMAERMVEGMVEQAVTPTHLVALVQGNRSAAFGKDAAPAAEETKGATEEKVEWEGSFNSSDRYTLNVLDKETHKPAVTLTMRREGLSWKLTAVQLPLDGITQEESTTD